MPNLDLFFDNDINISAQVGDIAYFASTSSVSEFKTSEIINNLGSIVSITYDTTSEKYKVVVQVATGTVYPNTSTDFIMFSKSNVVNSSSALGYYSEVKFENDSDEEFELYSVSLEVAESSK